MRVQRPHHLVGYWVDAHFVIHDVLRGTRRAVSPFVVRLLNLCGAPQSATSLAAQLPEISAPQITQLLRTLLKNGLLEAVGPRVRNGNGAGGWRDWSPSAAFFHFSTKDVRYPASPEDALRIWDNYGPSRPMPSPVKRYARGRRVPLPVRAASGPFAEVLLSRRTWREFAPEPVDLNRLSTLLQLTWGVQRWAVVAGQGRVALKTSPSGGARHPGEVYVFARRVRGLPRGLYHYDGAGHELTRLPAQSRLPPVSQILPGQPWSKSAPVLLIMTAVFERSQWRYQFPRAYRAVLIEAGHLCQTCCLVATWLGLAPFCSMAFADTRVEACLGLDGVSESALYITGVGVPPKGGWRPWSPKLAARGKETFR